MRETFSSRPCRAADGSCIAASTAPSPAEPGGGAFRTRSLLIDALRIPPLQDRRFDPAPSVRIFTGPLNSVCTRPGTGLLIAVLVFLPLVLAYTAWVFRVLRDRITLESVREHTGLY
jgi:hypothetical protein